MTKRSSLRTSASLPSQQSETTQSERSIAKARKEEAASMDATGLKIAADDKAQAELHRTQSEKFIDMARELGLDEREEAFDAALTKVAKHRAGASEDKAMARSGLPKDADLDRAEPIKSSEDGTVRIGVPIRGGFAYLDIGGATRLADALQNSEPEITKRLRRVIRDARVLAGNHLEIDV